MSQATDMTFKAPRRSRLGASALWNTLGQLLSAVAALSTVRIMTELLEPAEFGQLTVLLGVSLLVNGSSVGPWLQGMLRLYPDLARTGSEATLRETTRRILTRNVLAMAAVVVAACLGLWWLGLAEPAFGPLVIGFLIVDSARNFEVALLNAAQRQRAAALINVADAWARPLAALLAVALAGPSVTAAALGYLAGSALTVLAARLSVDLEGKAPEGGPSRMDGELASSLNRYAIPLIPLGLFGWVTGVSDRYVIGGALGLGAAGLYAAVYGLVSRPFLMLSGIVELTMRPVLHNAIAHGDLDLERSTKRNWLLLTLSGSVLGLLLTTLLHGAVARVFLAESYREFSAAMPVIALGYVLHNMATVFARQCYAYKDTTAVLTLEGTAAVAVALTMLPGVLIWGVWGAVWAVPAAFLAELAVAVALSVRAERRFRQSSKEPS